MGKLDTELRSIDADRITDRFYNAEELRRANSSEMMEIKRTKKNETGLNIDRIVNLARRATRLLHPAKPL
jgi:hypothetical protein